MGNSILQQDKFVPTTKDKPEEQKLKIYLPVNWWCSQNSYALPEPDTNQLYENKLNFISNQSSDKRVKQMPKPNNWELTEGDYVINEKNIDVALYRKRKKIFYIGSLIMTALVNILMMFLLIGLLVDL
ncbi:MAG: hypothetical protein CVV23_06570 [Ignavibacteriae bacterium HGW-Ignavibacteriae-2]|jgi:hypothetical protein|nr:MAG: hypothetical protein CVV23_06570 [Ignavibacteriae bacterium HGW-Ignavibacteriae-2]